MTESQKELWLSGCNRRPEANMWPLTRKRSSRFAVLARIAVFRLCISQLNGSGYLCEKICIRSHRSGYLCKKNLHPFEQLGLSVRKTLSSVRKKLTSVQTARAICSKQSLLLAADFTWAVRDLVAQAGVTRQTCQKMWMIWYKRCVNHPNELSRYVFCRIMILAFTTSIYRYTFYSRLSLNNKFEQFMVWPFCIQISNAFGGWYLP